MQGDVYNPANSSSQARARRDEFVTAADIRRIEVRVT